MDTKRSSAGVAVAAAAARDTQTAARSNMTITAAGLAPCERVAVGPGETQAAPTAAPASPEACSTTEQVQFYAGSHPVTNCQEAAPPPQSRHPEEEEGGARASREDHERRSRSVPVLATDPWVSPGLPLDAVMPKVGVSPQAMPPGPEAATSTATRPTTAVPPHAAPSLALKRLLTAQPQIAVSTPTRAMARSPLAAATAATSEATVAAPQRKVTPRVQETQCATSAAAAAATGERTLSAVTPRTKTEVLKAFTRDRQNDCAVDGLCKEWLFDCCKTNYFPGSTSSRKHGLEGSLQLTSNNTFSSRNSSTLNIRGTHEDASASLQCCGRAGQTAAAVAGGGTSSALSSLIIPHRLLSANILGSSPASPAAGTACPSPSSCAVACAPAAAGLFAAAHVAGIIGCPCGGEVGGRGTASTVFPSHMQLQRQPYSQHGGDWLLHQQVRQHVHRQLLHSQQAGQQRQQPPDQSPGQHQELPHQQQHQRGQQGQNVGEQRLQRQAQHEQPGQYHERLLQQRLLTQQEQQLQHQRGHQQCSQHKSIRLFLMEDYEGPELPQAHPLVSLCFGTSSEEEEEQQQQHAAAHAARLVAPVAASAGEASVAQSSNQVGCAVLKKKKKRERKISVGATDALWQPHFHPHNQEFRVRYRYKGSMRLKTLSCVRFGREGARRLTAAFVQRWQKSGRRIAAKTHRSKLALSDLPPDIHQLPVYDKKRPAAPPVNRSESSSCYPGKCTITNAFECSCKDCRSTSTSQCCGGRINCEGSSTVRTDHCQNTGISAAQVPPPLAAAVTAQTPRVSDLTEQPLPLCTISRPISLLEVLPAAVRGPAADSVSSAVSASVTSAAAPASSVSYTPAPGAPLHGSSGPFWSAGTPTAVAPSTSQGRDGTGAVPSQRRALLDKNTRDYSTATLSWKADHIPSSHAQSSCGSDPFFDASATSCNTRRSSPGTIPPRGTSSRCGSSGCGDQSVRRSTSCDHLDSCCSFEKCSANARPLSSCCHGRSECGSAGRSNFAAVKPAVHSVASRTSGAASVDAGEVNTPDGVNRSPEDTRHTSKGLPGAIPGATTCLLPLDIFGCSADSRRRPSPAASGATFFATPEDQVTKLLPATGVESSVGPTPFLGAPLPVLPVTPAAAISADADTAVATADATSAAAPAVCHSASPALRTACENHPAPRTLPSPSETLVRHPVGAILAGASGTAVRSPDTSVAPSVVPPTAAASHLSQYAPDLTVNAARSHIGAATFRAISGPAAAPQIPPAAEGTSGAAGALPADVCAAVASPAAIAPTLLPTVRQFTWCLSPTQRQQP